MDKELDDRLTAIESDIAAGFDLLATWIGTMLQGAKEPMKSKMAARLSAITQHNPHGQAWAEGALDAYHDDGVLLSDGEGD